jgi:hypothetical protein
MYDKSYTQTRFLTRALPWGELRLGWCDIVFVVALIVPVALQEADLYLPVCR